MKILSLAAEALGCAALILAAALAFGPAARADTGANHWTAQQTATAPDGTSRVLWTAESHTGLGKVAGVWVLDAAGSVTHIGTTYGPYTDSNGSWTAKQLSVASDGTARLLWTNVSISSVEVSVWTLDATGSVTSTGPTYTPTADTSGSWYPQQLAGASDGTSRLLWTELGTAGAKAGVWTLDATGTETHVGTTYGPYSGWAASGFGIDTADNTMRVLWYDTSSTSSGDAAGLWSFDSNGTETLIGPAYGPYAGWSAVSVAVLADGTSRVVWEQNTASYRSGGTVVGEWAFDSGDRETAIGSTYGPFGNWSVQDASLDESDRTLRLLWDRSDDTSGLWSLNSGGIETSISITYGPYTY